jgi:hypothetical protein
MILIQIIPAPLTPLCLLILQILLAGWFLRPLSSTPKYDLLLKELLLVIKNELIKRHHHLSRVVICIDKRINVGVFMY